MKRRDRFILFSMLFSVVLAACGGGGGGNGNGGDDGSGGGSNNTSPVFTSGTAVSVLENIQAVMTVQATDADGDTLAYGLSGGLDKTAFKINSTTGALSFDIAPDFENPHDNDNKNDYLVEVSVTDGDITVVQSLTVTVKDMQGAPVIINADTSPSVAENTTAVLNVIAVDDEGDSLSYEISGGADGSLFDIDVSGKLTFKSPPDFENLPAKPLEVEVKVIDATKNQDTKTFMVTVADVNEVPQITSPNTAIVTENTTVVMTIEATDPESDLLTYQIVGGLDQALFSFDGSGNLIFNNAPDYEAPGDSDANNIYLVQVAATDGTLTSPTQEIAVTIKDIDDPSSTPVLSVGFSPKQLVFSWGSVPLTGYYQLMVDPDGVSGFSIVTGAANILAPTTTYRHNIAVYEVDWDNAIFALKACNGLGCSSLSNIVTFSLNDNDMLATIGYVKASNTDADDNFGNALALSRDGNTLAIGARNEDSNATDEADNTASSAGAVYIYTRDADGVWNMQDYLKASNTEAGDEFGHSLALSANGDTLVVGAPKEDSASQTINVGEDDNTGSDAGAVYVFTRSDTTWTKQAYLKGADTDTDDNFGSAVAVSADGTVIAVGAQFAGPGGIGANTQKGAVYLFAFDGSNWSQPGRRVVAANGDKNDGFGAAVSLSHSGDVLAVGAEWEDGDGRGISPEPPQPDTDVSEDNNSGAVYVYIRNGNDWLLDAYFKAANADPGDNFGHAISLSGDGATLAVGAYQEDSIDTGVSEGQSTQDIEQTYSGAVYVFSQVADTWSQQAYVKATNTGTFDNFGWSLALSNDGNVLVVGANGEGSNAMGIDGNDALDSAPFSGAAYLYRRSGDTWSSEITYIKASNTGGGDQFGYAIGLSGDGKTLAVGALGEDGDAVLIGDNDNDNKEGAGAVYLY